MSNTICPHCKTSLNEGATVCTGCGAKYGYLDLNNNVRYLNGIEEQKSEIKKAAIFLIIFGVILIPFFGLGVFVILAVLAAVISRTSKLNKQLAEGPSWYK